MNPVHQILIEAVEVHYLTPLKPYFERILALPITANERAHIKQFWTNDTGAEMQRVWLRRQILAWLAHEGAIA